MVPVPLSRLQPSRIDAIKDWPWLDQDVLRTSRWDPWSQQLEVTVGELLPVQPVPLLKRRLELSRKEALKLWTEKRQQGWQITAPQWQPPRLPATG
jgi:hypothetical protein